MHRRAFLQSLGGGLAATLAGSRTLFARVPTENRLVVILLRGGLDGLHALIPHGDADFRRLRPSLNPARDGLSGVIDLDGYFALHAALAPLHPLYGSGELTLIPAAATRYRNRSHFDGQNLLENGSGVPFGADDGWLNRAILSLNAGDRRLGLSIGSSLPLIMRGEAGVQTWAESSLPEVDEDFLLRLSNTYRHDALFLDALHDGSGALNPDLPMAGMAGMADNPAQGENFVLDARAAADLLSHPMGPRIAVMDIDGWDTHLNQEGRLTRLFRQLSRGILALQSGLGADWSRTIVVVASEFGRTAAENGSRGTDHGTGGLAMLAGGAVAGGRIAGDWPGLSPTALWEGRDLRAVNSYEAIFKAILIGHLGVDAGLVEDRIFPASAAFRPMEGLLRGT